ncbi:MAG: glycoside hydrolase family 3 N-terminal domain-containing protein [Lacrimispora saccharolytica]
MENRTFGIVIPELAECSRKAAAEGAVLLKNEDGVLPFRKEECISVFGRIQFDFYRSGTGSGGAVNAPFIKNLVDGFRENQNLCINEELVSIYETWRKDHPVDDGGGVWAGEPWNQADMDLTPEIVRAAREKSEKAVYVIGRTAGEDKDNTMEEGGYCLTAQEKKNLELITASFEKTVVLLNVANIIDMSWIEDEAYHGNIKSVLYCWQGGQIGGLAVADVLSGDVTPSGKLTDTIARRIEDYPSDKNFGDRKQNIYQEDIYVGYRYFETFCPEKVLYPFGFGLSYTDFKLSVLSGSERVENGETYIRVQVQVENTGSFAGKETVQLYVSAPQGVLGKPALELKAFQKTRLLQPGEAVCVSLSVPATALASYDDSGATGAKSAYVLEPGAYTFYVGNSIQNLQKAEIDGQEAWNVSSLIVTEQLEEALAPETPFERMKPGTANEAGTWNLTYEPVPLRTVDLAARMESRLPKELPQTGNQGITLRDVADGEADLETFLSQLSDEDLKAIVRGEGMSSPKVTPGTAAAFGGVTDSLISLGVPIACAADGPSGIRMEGGYSATQMPIGTLLACTWNPELAEELYTLEGKEMYANQVDTLLGPGVNIHRHPLNGRNFEYFSEDPYLTGCFAAAAVRGMRAERGVGTVKHFAANNQETARSEENSVVSERALREIYLKGFEMAVKEGGATSIMTSYNAVNGHWAASNYDLNTTILRGEWGYQGIVMTDWWACMNHPVNGGPSSRKRVSYMVRSQNDLYMVVPNHGAADNANGDDLQEALDEKSLTRGELQRCAGNICRFLMTVPCMDRNPKLQERVELQKAFAEATEEMQEHALPLEADLEYRMDFEHPLTLKVTEPGAYFMEARLSSASPEMSQVFMEFLLNKRSLLQVQMGGTLGKPSDRKLAKIRLEEGYYLLEGELQKPDLTIEWVKFHKLDQ